VGNEWGVDDETAKVMRANLEALSAGPGDDAGGHVQECPEAPWWRHADAMTMTIVVGAEVSTVAEALGHDLAAMERMLVLEAPCEEGASPLALFGTGGAVAIVEPNGWTTVQPDVVTILSRLGPTVALYWNVNLLSRFVVAHNGEIVRDFDPVIDGGAGTGTPLPEETGVDWALDPIATAAALQSRVTNVHLTRAEVFGTPHPTTTVPWPL